MVPPVWTVVPPVWMVISPSTGPQSVVPPDLVYGIAQGSVSQTDTGQWYRPTQAVVPPVPGEPMMGKF